MTEKSNKRTAEERRRHFLRSATGRATKAYHSRGGKRVGPKPVTLAKTPWDSIGPTRPWKDK